MCCGFGIIRFFVIFILVFKDVQLAVRTKSASSGADSEYQPIQSMVGRRGCDTGQIEYRLTKLEVQVAEKAENLRSELREGDRRLQALENQGAETQSAVEGFRNELGRFTESGQPVRSTSSVYQDEQDKMGTRVENLAKGLQLVVAALRTLNSDMGWMKKNVSSILDSSSTIERQYEHLVSKEFLKNSLIELKHHEIYQHRVPENVFVQSEKIPKNCKEILKDGQKVSGIYLIQPENSRKPFMVLCDMETRDGGWTYIHNRFEGSQNFYLNWHDYKTGFGNLGGEFWLGLENIYQLTGNDVNELLVELSDANNANAHAHYSAFSLGSELEGYNLKVLGGYSGDAGDSLIYHAGSRFSTKDLDQDSWEEGSCAQSHGGAWWYRGCDTSNLNGKYLNGELPEAYLYQGMYWGEFRGAQYSLSRARMMVRPRDENSSALFPNGIGRTVQN